jgi:hypothetical protein
MYMYMYKLYMYIYIYQNYIPHNYIYLYIYHIPMTFHLLTSSLFVAHLRGWMMSAGPKNQTTGKP